VIDLNDMVVATVAARPLQGVMCEPPEIDIHFGRPEDIQLDPQKEWLMIEAKQGYFEAYRHTLRALQKLSQEK
jgi:helicase required for RNAi-mediated heterochromatin assembly 1